MRFIEGEIYHIFNRGVDGKDIFLDSWDYHRFLNGLFLFNTDAPVLQRTANFERENKNNQRLCSLLCYVLMKNHVHLLIYCSNPNSLSRYLQKLFIGYTMYFNHRYARSGVLFASGSKAKHIAASGYFSHIVDYIHLNPLDYTFPEWRSHEVKNIIDAKKSLLSYPYSSMRGFIGSDHDQSLDLKKIKNLFPAYQEALYSALEWSSDDFDATLSELFE